MFYPDQLIDKIVALPAIKKIWVAYSGGLDSHVLLHVLAKTTDPRIAPVHALYVNHNLHENSADWASHCANNASLLKVEFTSIDVNVIDDSNEGIEAAARTARYAAFSQQINDGELLLTGQHQEDQAETLLLQLLRGAGPKGLAAMPEQIKFSAGHLLRPLLNTSQLDILAYAQQHNLNWIEDPSNLETRWNRNYLRHEVWPKLVKRWPSAAVTISRSARHCAETNELLTALAEQDLADIDGAETDDSLTISRLLSLAEVRCRNLLRFWIERKGFGLPSTDQLQRVITEVCLAATDSNPVLRWSGVEVRRYQDELYFLSPLNVHDAKKSVDWSGLDKIDLGGGLSVKWLRQQGKGLSESIVLQGVTVRFRQGGERLRPSGHSKHKSLKHLFQEWGIPTWERDRIPLIYSGENLIAVANHIVDEKFSVSVEELGFSPVVETKY